MQAGEIIDLRKRLYGNDIDMELLACAKDKEQVLINKSMIKQISQYSISIKLKCLENEEFYNMIKNAGFSSKAIEKINLYEEAGIIDENVKKWELEVIAQLCEINIKKENLYNIKKNPVIAIFSNKKIQPQACLAAARLVKDEEAEVACAWINSLDEKADERLGLDIIEVADLKNYRDYEKIKDKPAQWFDNAIMLKKNGILFIPQWADDISLVKKTWDIIDNKQKFVSFLNNTRFFTAEEINLFLTNYMKADEDMKKNAFESRFTISCIIREYKASKDWLRGKYIQNEQAMNSFVEYAVRNYKDKFLYMLCNSDTKPLNKIKTDSIMYNEYFYGSCINLDELTFTELMYLCSISGLRWQAFHKLDALYNVQEINELVYCNENYVKLANIIKKSGHNTDNIIRELKQINGFGNMFNEKELRQLAKTLNGRTFENTYEAYFKNKEILYETAACAFAKLPPEMLGEIKDEEELRFCISNCELGESLEEITQNFIKKQEVSDCINKYGLDLSEKEKKKLAQANLVIKMQKYADEEEYAKGMSAFIKEKLYEQLNENMYTRLEETLGNSLTPMQLSIWKSNMNHENEDIYVYEKDSMESLLEHTSLMADAQGRKAVSTLFTGVVKVFEFYVNKTLLGTAEICLVTLTDKPPKSGIIKDSYIAMYLNKINLNNNCNLGYYKYSLKELTVQCAIAKSRALGIKLFLSTAYMNVLPINMYKEKNICMINYMTEYEYTYNFIGNHNVMVQNQGKYEKQTVDMLV